MKNAKYSEEAKKQMSVRRTGAGNPFFGRKHSKETIEKMRKQRIGKKNAFYGKKHSKESLKKISDKLKEQFVNGRINPIAGTRRSDETKRKISKTRIRLGIAKGKNNPRWIDGKNRSRRELRISEMNTAKYRNWRKCVFERDAYTCVECGQRGGDLNADHIKPWAYFIKLRYRLSNGRTLCVKCHRKTYKDIHKYNVGRVE